MREKAIKDDPEITDFKSSVKLNCLASYNFKQTTYLRSGQIPELVAQSYFKGAITRTKPSQSPKVWPCFRNEPEIMSQSCSIERLG